MSQIRKEATAQLARYLRSLQGWWSFFALGVFIGAGSVYGISQFKALIYRAEATMLANQTQTLGILMGAFAGLLLAGALVLAYKYLYATGKPAKNVAATARLPTLGCVARFSPGRTDADNIVVGSPQRTAAAEAYEVLRTNLQFSTIDARALLVSSANPDEGKTTTVANLAISIAQTGQRVVVVDSDLRHPALHRVFGLSNGKGLSNALLSEEPGLSLFLQATRFENLSVLTSGPLPLHPSELLSSYSMDAVVDALRREAEITLFDSPAALAVADASVLAAKLDGTILVVDAGRTLARGVQRAGEELGRSEARVFGVVLNKLIGGGHCYYSYAYNQRAPSPS